MIVTTAEDRALAARLLVALKTRDAASLAGVLAQIRETAVVCATVRVEREFDVKERKR